jgi:endo-alpha-1,4-polygalactosaminidase (GH114 family)
LQTAAYKMKWLTTFMLVVTFCSCVPDTETANSTQNPDMTLINPTLNHTKPIWKPEPGLSWQWQLMDPPVDMSIEADVYDIDLFDNDASVINTLHKKGRKVICYISVGSWEDWRPDKDQFPPKVLGNDYAGWPGERWLDIRQIDQLAPIMRARLDLCASKGFDAVEPDNIEIFNNNTGFPLTYQDQLDYALWLAQEAHMRGLAIGLKNAADQIPDLIDIFDFMIVEDYFYYDLYRDTLPFITAGKAVFAAEYTDMAIEFDSICQKAKKNSISVILKNRDLDAFRDACHTP